MSLEGVAMAVGALVVLIFVLAIVIRPKARRRNSQSAS